MVRLTSIWIWLVLVVEFMMAMTVAARTAGGATEAQKLAIDQAAAKKAAYLAKFDWHDDEIGIFIDALTSKPDPKEQRWNMVEIKGRVFTAERHYTHVAIKFSIYKGGTKIGEVNAEIQADFKERTGYSFRASKPNIPLPRGTLTWKVEQVICLVEGGEEAHYFGPARAADAVMAELNANLDRFENYTDEFGILSDAGPFYSTVGDQYLIDIKGKAISYNYDCASVLMKFSIYSGDGKIADAAASTNNLAKTTFWQFRVKQSIPASQVRGTLTYQVEEIICKDGQGRAIIHYVKQ